MLPQGKVQTAKAHSSIFADTWSHNCLNDAGLHHDIKHVPKKGGSSQYSPNMIVTNQGVLMDRLRIRFGLYVQVWEPPTQKTA